MRLFALSLANCWLSDAGKHRMPERGVIESRPGLPQRLILDLAPGHAFRLTLSSRFPPLPDRGPYRTIAVEEIVRFERLESRPGAPLSPDEEALAKGITPDEFRDFNKVADDVSRNPDLWSGFSVVTIPELPTWRCVVISGYPEAGADTFVVLPDPSMAALAHAYSVRPKRVQS